MRDSESTPDGLDAVAAWRKRVLTVGGFPEDIAHMIALEQRIDIHELLELTEQGCAPDLAVRILAPLVNFDQKESSKGEKESSKV